MSSLKMAGLLKAAAEGSGLTMKVLGVRVSQTSKWTTSPRLFTCAADTHSELHAIPLCCSGTHAHAQD